jgi:hypothetical protein
MLSQLGFKHLAVAERIQSSGAKIEKRATSPQPDK